MTLSPRAQQLMRSLALTLELVKEHEKFNPAETEQIYASLVAHLRSVRPVLLTGTVL